MRIQLLFGRYSFRRRNSIPKRLLGSQFSFKFTIREVIQGDLYEPILGEKFDLIIANPPFMPSVDDKGEKALFSDGGVNGEQILLKIIDGLQEHLNYGGEAIILAGGFGNGDNPSVVSEINRFALENDWCVNLVIINQASAKETMKQTGISFPNQYDNVNIVSDNLGPDITHYYSILISIKRDCKPD